MLPRESSCVGASKEKVWRCRPAAKVCFSGRDGVWPGVLTAGKIFPLGCATGSWAVMTPTPSPPVLLAQEEEIQQLITRFQAPRPAGQRHRLSAGCSSRRGPDGLTPFGWSGWSFAGLKRERRRQTVATGKRQREDIGDSIRELRHAQAGISRIGLAASDRLRIQEIQQVIDVELDPIADLV
jgi:hypothetical protein